MFKTDESRQAAWLTLGVWAMSATFFTVTTLVGGRPMTASLLATLVAFDALGLVLSFMLYKIAGRVRLLPLAVRLAVMVAAVMALSTVLSLGDVLIMDLERSLVSPEAAAPAKSVAIRTVLTFPALTWIFGTLSALYMTLHANWTVRERERQLADARTAASEANAAASAARLAALRYQLNPHFLFNTLNAVSAAVITGRSDEAETMLSKLADFLRVTLVADPQALIPLEDELATLQAYLEIESVRFRDRLAVEFVCPDDLRNAQTPSFLLQPLIENAIKHGVSPTSETVTIRLEASREGEDLVLKVQDDGGGGQGGEVRPGAGVGLANIRMRLETLYGERGSLQALPLARGYLAIVRLPLQWNAAVTPFRRRAAA